MITMKKKYYKIFFVAYFLLIILVSFFRFPDIRNEFKYFIITDDSLRDKSFFVLEYFNELYPDKPPIYFWILMLVRTIFKSYFYPMALLIGGIIPAGVTAYFSFKIVKLYWNEKMAYMTTATLITLPYLFGISLVLRMDYLMTMFIVGSIYVFLSEYKRNDYPPLAKIVLFYVLISLGILSKGGAAFVIPVLSIITFLYLNKDLKYFKKMRPFLGIGIIFLVLIIWFLCILQNELGTEYIKLLLGQETVGRMVKSKSHIKPIYYYLLRLPMTILPITPFFILGLYDNIKNIKKTELIDKVAISIFLPNFIFFSLISGKLDIYLLPLYFSINIIAIRAIWLRFKDSKLKFYKGILGTNIFVFLLCAITLPYYNSNYTLKPIVDVLKNESGAIYSSRLVDSKNIAYEIKRDTIENILPSQIKKLNDGDIILVRKKHMSNFKKAPVEVYFKTKNYILLKKV